MKIIMLLILTLPLSEVFAQFDINKVKNRYEEIKSKDYILLPHNGYYLLPISYNGNPNEAPFKRFKEIEQFQERGNLNRNLEAEFQVSFMIGGMENLFNKDLDFFLGYTQKSWWQLYNSDWSRPFRETNYKPELFLRKNFFKTDTEIFDMKVYMLDIGYVHESNGQLQEFSRSWDRLFVSTVVGLGGFFISPSLWYRIPETSKEDDNPDIQKYLGYGELNIRKVYSKSQFDLKLIPGYKQWGGELAYSHAHRKGVRWYLKLSSGTGLSLLDYDHVSQKFGLGFILTDILTSEE